MSIWRVIRHFCFPIDKNKCNENRFFFIYSNRFSNHPMPLRASHITGTSEFPCPSGRRPGLDGVLVRVLSLRSSPVDTTRQHRAPLTLCSGAQSSVLNGFTSKLTPFGAILVLRPSARPRPSPASSYVGSLNVG